MHRHHQVGNSSAASTCRRTSCAGCSISTIARTWTGSTARSRPRQAPRGARPDAGVMWGAAAWGRKATTRSRVGAGKGSLTALTHLRMVEKHRSPTRRASSHAQREGHDPGSQCRVEAPTCPPTKERLARQRLAAWSGGQHEAAGAPSPRVCAEVEVESGLAFCADLALGFGEFEADRLDG